MARLPRLFLPGIPSHVTLRGNDRRSVFRSDGDRLGFLKELREAARDHGLAIHAYVLMTNHVHLLATGAGPASLAQTIESVGRKYVPRFNRRHERTGTLWEGRYRSTLVESDRYFLNCQRYIELNPVRAGLAPDPALYIWSSHLHYGHGKPDDLVTPHALVESLGGDGDERRNAYRGLFATPMPQEIVEEIRAASYKGWVLGSHDFCARVERLTGRRASPVSPGRPRKIRV